MHILLRRSTEISGFAIEAAANLRGMAPHPLTWLDVFAAGPLAGNQLAVVHDADCLDEATMLAFARETMLSETTFVQTAGVAGATYRNRIFWMNGEMSFAGHPSLGTAVAVARIRGDSRASYVQQTRSGEQPVEVEFSGDLTARASIRQEPAIFGGKPDPGRVLAAAGLAGGVGDPRVVPQVVSTGIGHLIAPLASATDLDSARPDPVELKSLLDDCGCATLYLAVVDTDAGRSDARGFFVNPRGLAEDPATGSAAGPLLALFAEQLGITEITVTQGVTMGRPSQLDCTISNGRVAVAGTVVIIAEGNVHLPD